MNQLVEAEVLEDGEVTAIAIPSMGGMVRDEIDMQIATAKRYPRSVAKFVKEATGLVQLSEQTAQECMYALPRGNKPITGPSIRFAEVICALWKNCRASARIIDIDDKFVKAQGIFIDLENNSAVAQEVSRRITSKDGKRFNDDMIGVTSNAACSIAKRNAILAGIPKAFWVSVYDASRLTAIGDVKTLASKREIALQKFMQLGITKDHLFAKLGIAGIEDITLDHLEVLIGYHSAIKNGEITPESVFDTMEPKKVQKSSVGDALETAPKAKPKGKDGELPLGGQS